MLFSYSIQQRKKLFTTTRAWFPTNFLYSRFIFKNKAWKQLEVDMLLNPEAIKSYQAGSNTMEPTRHLPLVWSCLILDQFLIPQYQISKKSGKYDAESPKQGSKRFNSITKKIHFAHLGILIIYICLLLYSVTKGVKQNYLLYIYLIGSVYINIDNSKCSNIQSYNWLTGSESIPLLAEVDWGADLAVLS